MKKEIWDLLIVGDTYHPVPQFVSNWIVSEPDESEFPLPHVDEPPAEILEFCELQEGDEDADIYLSCSCWDNDRALWITGYAECFETIKEVIEFYKENNYDLGEEFQYEEY